MWPYYFLKTKIFEWREQKVVAKHFYDNPQFRALDQALLVAYREKSPYQISKQYLMQQGAKNLYDYGETPLTTMAKIVKECGITSADTIIEMGAGRGRAALFLAEYVGCRVLAYEHIPTFIEKIPSSSNLEMIGGDMFSADFSPATAIFLYGTMLEDDEILKLVKRFSPKAKVITVSYPLNAYSNAYRTCKRFSGRFPWGKTDIFLNEFAPFGL